MRRSCKIRLKMGQLWFNHQCCKAGCETLAIHSSSQTSYSLPLPFIGYVKDLAPLSHLDGTSAAHIRTLTLTSAPGSITFSEYYNLSTIIDVQDSHWSHIRRCALL